MIFNNWALCYLFLASLIFCFALWLANNLILHLALVLDERYKNLYRPVVYVVIIFMYALLLQKTIFFISPDPPNRTWFVYHSFALPVENVFERGNSTIRILVALNDEKDHIIDEEFSDSDLGKGAPSLNVVVGESFQVFLQVVTEGSFLNKFDCIDQNKIVKTSAVSPAFDIISSGKDTPAFQSTYAPDNFMSEIRQLRMPGVCVISQTFVVSPKNLGHQTIYFSTEFPAQKVDMTNLPKNIRLSFNVQPKLSVENAVAILALITGFIQASIAFFKKPDHN